MNRFLMPVFAVLALLAFSGCEADGYQARFYPDKGRAYNAPSPVFRTFAEAKDWANAATAECNASSIKGTGHAATSEYKILSITIREEGSE